MGQQMSDEERAAVGHLLVILTNRINEQDVRISEQDIAIGKLISDMGWMKQFISGLPKIVEDDT